MFGIYLLLQLVLSYLIYTQWKKQAWMCMDRLSDEDMVGLRCLFDIKMFVSIK